MKLKVFLFILLFFSALIGAQTPVACSTTEIEWVNNKYETGMLSNSKLFIGEIINKDSDRYDACVINKPLMSDGITFTLYKSSDNKIRYVLINNGLDGSYETYGPFISNGT